MAARTNSTDKSAGGGAMSRVRALSSAVIKPRTMAPQAHAQTSGMVWSGWLSKTGSKDKKITTSQRFFKLRDNGMFEYYENDRTTEPKGFVNLTDATNILPLKNGFEIFTPQRTWHMTDPDENPKKLMELIILLQETNDSLLSRKVALACRSSDPAPLLTPCPPAPPGPTPPARAFTAGQIRQRH